MTAINTTYQFVTDGDFINFLINDNLACTLSKDSNAVQWYFDNDPGIRFCIRGGTYFTRQPEDISFDGTPLTTKEEFVTGIKALFPVYAGGTGIEQDLNSVLGVGNSANGRGIHDLLDPASDQDAATKKYVDDNAGGGGIDTVLSVGQALTDDRDIEISGKILRFLNNGLLAGFFDGTLNAESAAIVARNNTDDGNIGQVSGSVSDVNAAATLKASFNGDAGARITAYQDTTIKSLTHTADLHDFIGPVVMEANGDPTPLVLLGIQEFADNAAAISGGVPTGGLYYTIVLGERILKFAFD